MTTPRRAPLNHAALPAAALLALAAVAGCTVDRNSDLAINDEFVLPTFVPHEPTDPEVLVTERPGQSVFAPERDNWAPITVSVPVAGVAHYPTYGVRPRFARETARQRGEYPTALTATMTGGDESLGAQALEGLAEPFYSALDIVMFIPRAISAPPWTVVESPIRGYERGPDNLPPALRAPVESAELEDDAAPADGGVSPDDEAGALPEPMPEDRPE